MPNADWMAFTLSRQSDSMPRADASDSAAAFFPILRFAAIAAARPPCVSTNETVTDVAWTAASMAGSGCGALEATSAHTASATAKATPTNSLVIIGAAL